MSVDLPGQMGPVLFVFLLAVAIINVVTVRFFVLPAPIGIEEPGKAQLVLTSYIFAVAPATYGLVISLYTAQELLTLPFAVVALFGLFISWSYLRDAAIG